MLRRMATGCFVSTGRSLPDAIERVKLAESLGYDAAYTTHINGRDSLTVLAAYALATERIRVGTGVIPIYTFALGATWSRVVGGTSVGAMLAYHETRLDVSKANRWTMDLGASRSLLGDRLRLAAATHFFSSVRMDDPAQDLFAGVEVRLWKSPATTNTTIIRGRYGISFAHGYTADHQVGLGAEFSKNFAVDAMVTREGSYGSDPGWRPSVGLRIGIGKYRITLARDTGVNEVGSAYRVGVDVRLK